jgi:hypothetical protein
VYHEGQLAGIATPFQVSRHVHPQVPQAALPPAVPTGVDYLNMVLSSYNEEQFGAISFRDATGGEEGTA